MDQFERIIRPIVEGQIRGFIKEHPSILDGVNWYDPRQDKTRTLVNSLSKRIVCDLVCPITRARLGVALLAAGSDKPPGDAVGTATDASPELTVEGCTAVGGDGLGGITESIA